jgi:hypothetical protein
MSEELDLTIEEPVWWLKAIGARYFTTRTWHETRDRILEERGEKCEFCGLEGGFYTVHHVTYDRVAEELDEDLIVLCWACHNLVHRPTSRAAKFWLVELSKRKEWSKTAIRQATADLNPDVSYTEVFAGGDLDE